MSFKSSLRRAFFVCINEERRSLCMIILGIRNGLPGI